MIHQGETQRLIVYKLLLYIFAQFNVFYDSRGLNVLHLFCIWNVEHFILMFIFFFLFSLLFFFRFNYHSLSGSFILDGKIPHKQNSTQWHQFQNIGNPKQKHVRNFESCKGCLRIHWLHKRETPKSIRRFPKIKNRKNRKESQHSKTNSTRVK